MKADRGEKGKMREEAEEERGDTIAGRAVPSVPADKTNLSEYSSTGNAVHLKNSIFLARYWNFDLVSHAGPGRSSCSVEKRGGFASYSSQ